MDRIATLSDRLARGPVYYGWYVVGVVFVATLVRTGFSGILFGVFLKPMAEEFGWSRTAITGAVTVGTLVAAVLAFGIGHLLDRYGSRIVIVTSGLLLGASYFGLSFVGSLLAYYLIYTLGRLLMQAALGPSVLPTVVAKWFVRQRGRAIAISSLGGAGGGAILLILTQLIIDHYGWRTAWAAQGVLTWALLLPPAILLLRRQPEDLGLLPDGGVNEPQHRRPDGRAMPADARQGASEISLSLQQALGSPAFWALAAVSGISSLATTGVTFHMIPHLTDAGVSARAAVTAYSIFTFIQLFSILASGVLADRTGAKPSLLASVLVMAVGVFLVAQANGNIGAYSSAVVLGIGFGGYITLLNLLWAEYFGRQHLGSIRGVSLLFQLVGNAFGSLLAAAIFDATGSYQGAFAAVLAMNGLVFALLVLTRRPSAQELVRPAN